jgi:hypothetical protein
MGMVEEVERAKATLVRLRGSKEWQERLKKEEVDAEKRSDPLGFFNYAESYFAAAQALQKAKIKVTHPDEPVRFLYYHALELYLKSFLRVHNATARELSSRDFGHRYCCLVEEAVRLKLPFSEDDLRVFCMILNSDTVIRARYIETGYFIWPQVEALELTCTSVRKPVGAALSAAGFHVRM